MINVFEGYCCGIGGSYFKRKLEDIRIYDRALNEEIFELYHEVGAGRWGNGYWREP